MEREPRDREVPEDETASEDEAATSEPIDSASYGRIVELAEDDDVDGDWNGAPELAGLEETHAWTGVDALDAMRGRDAQQTNFADDVPIAERIAVLEEQRRELVERLEALQGELPERVIASDSKPQLAENGDALLDAATIAEDLGRRIQRLDEALARLAEEAEGEERT